MKYFLALTLLGMAGSARASVIYELSPGVYTALPGGTVRTFAAVTNTGAEILYYAYSFVDPGTVPVAGITGQLPPAILQPGDRVYFTAATITTTPETKPGAYSFIAGVGYRPALGGPDVVVEASDVGTLVIVPEPASLFWGGFGCLAAMLALRHYSAYLPRGVMGRW